MAVDAWGRRVGLAVMMHAGSEQWPACGLLGVRPPFDSHHSTASNTTSPTSDPILHVRHSLSRLQAKPGEESRREQRGVGAGGTIDLHEILLPEILDYRRIEWNRVFTNLDSRSGVCEVS